VEGARVNRNIFARGAAKTLALWEKCTSTASRGTKNSIRFGCSFPNASASIPERITGSRIHRVPRVVNALILGPGAPAPPAKTGEMFFGGRLAHMQNEIITRLQAFTAKRLSNITGE
jgi:hypothetical protein